MSAAPHPNQVAFRDGVDYLFHSWTALKLAVDGEWGGHDSTAKRDWFVDTVVDYFSESKNRTFFFPVFSCAAWNMNLFFGGLLI